MAFATWQDPYRLIQGLCYTCTLQENLCSLKPLIRNIASLHYFLQPVNTRPRKSCLVSGGSCETKNKGFRAFVG